MTNEEKAMEGIAIATAPLRWAADLLKMAFLLVFLITCLIGYPVILFLNGESVSAASFLVPAFTILFLFMLFYAPVYTGCLLFIAFWFLAWCGRDSTNLQYVFVGQHPDIPVYIAFALVLIGIVQSYIIRSIDKASQPPKLRYQCESINEMRIRLADEEVGQMDATRFNTMRTLYGENFLLWPLESIGTQNWPIERLGKPSTPPLQRDVRTPPPCIDGWLVRWLRSRSSSPLVPEDTTANSVKGDTSPDPPLRFARSLSVLAGVVIGGVVLTLVAAVMLFWTNSTAH